MAVYMLIRLPVECIGLNEFYFSTVLLFALLGAGMHTARFSVPREKVAVRQWEAPLRHAGGSSARG
jgi:hypothetical protein